MKKTYYINGWCKGKWYFFGVGHFTVEDAKRMEDGETIVKDGREFRIKTEEEN